MKSLKGVCKGQEGLNRVKINTKYLYKTKKNPILHLHFNLCLAVNQC